MMKCYDKINDRVMKCNDKINDKINDKVIKFNDIAFLLLVLLA